MNNMKMNKETGFKTLESLSAKACFFRLTHIPIISGIPKIKEKIITIKLNTKKEIPIDF